MLALVCPVLHTNELAPTAVSVVEPPGQIINGVAVMAITGFAFTVTATLAVAEHPFPLVPVTVYVVDTFGLTTILAPVCPVFHVYVLAPTAVSVVDSPSQITDGDAEALTEAEPLTNTVTVAVVEQPFFVPVTLYVVVAVGLTVILAPD